MKNEDVNTDAVNKAIIGIAEGNLERVLGQFEEDAKWRRSPLLASGGTYEGKKAIEGMLAEMRERLGGRLHVLNLTMYGTGEQVFADYTISPSSDELAEGAEHVLTAFDVVLGKIREAREFVFSRR